MLGTDAEGECGPTSRSAQQEIPRAVSRSRSHGQAAFSKLTHTRTSNDTRSHQRSSGLTEGSVLSARSRRDVNRSSLGRFTTHSSHIERVRNGVTKLGSLTTGSRRHERSQSRGDGRRSARDRNGRKVWVRAERADPRREVATSAGRSGRKGPCRWRRPAPRGG